MAKANIILNSDNSSLNTRVIKSKSGSMGFGSNTFLKTWHIHIEGLVQGVGFRPFVYRLAKEFNLKGWVNNNADGVHIEFNADIVSAEQFYKTVIEQAPPLSAITKYSMHELKHRQFKSFTITESDAGENYNLLVTPDLAICKDCKAELLTKENRRYYYPFITCTHCGPRYSIIKRVPYDRENTMMQAFNMCQQCNDEYQDALSRRHFSQTNSCPDCAVTMQLFDNKKNLIGDHREKIISKVCELWEDGNIIAIKGTGGYLLTCDASNANAVKELRWRKHRPAKPFALMYPETDVLRWDVYLNETEINELESVQAPIVLLQLRENPKSNLAFNEIAPSLSRIGVMLPCTPLYVLLMEQFKKPIIATSGNISNAPIVFRDEEALNELNSIADYIFVNNREIVIPQDDSVIKYVGQTQQRIILRYARAFAPYYPNRSVPVTNETILATGAMLKSSFTLLHHGNIHISQYLGNTENVDAQNNFEHTVNHFLSLFSCKPEIILTDKHPDYFSSQFAKRLSSELNIPLIKVQHHEAHFAAVLAENNLIDEQEPVLGVIWDGTGFGNDGQIWGGEFFIYHQKKFNRISHIEYYDWMLGDKMAREPRISALSLCKGIKEAEELLKTKFSESEWVNYHKILSVNQLRTSSIGRVFDAVASLVGLIDKSSFEGEAAMLLEECALRYFNKSFDIPESWLSSFEWQHRNPVSIRSFIGDICNDMRKGRSKEEIAARFHVMLLLLVEKIAVSFNCNKICFSGGVFQNGLLTDLAIRILKKQHQLYFHRHLSPNDENISFGQLMHYITTK